MRSRRCQHATRMTYANPLVSSSTGGDLGGTMVVSGVVKMSAPPYEEWDGLDIHTGSSAAICSVGADILDQGLDDVGGASSPTRV
ncbi:hypothetical protein L6452_15443 [Arctium lappa]|uniref:Uncharacterized protein n=1 Tax=Arctium lappa TaxID=4217 RepID=A0ACB9CNQ8_ARCLA|nr:hypothetical protein L6452_15443 [Arctium lappa]